MDVLEQRRREGRVAFGLPTTFLGRRWLSEYGSDGLALAHGEPRPHPSPLITVGILFGSSGPGWIDVQATLGTRLLLAERSRNDPAFQFETRDQAVIERELRAFSGSEGWEFTTLDLNGSPREFLRSERGGDWMAFTEIDDEWVWVHVEQPDGTPVSIVTIHDVAPYLGNDA